MKLILFFLLIGFGATGSLIYEKVCLRKDKKLFITIIQTLILNLIVFGLGSAWWFFTETDGISQGVGVSIYAISFIVISVINLIWLFFWKDKNITKRIQS